MKKFRLFLYQDRLESNGQYIGKTREYVVTAKDDNAAMAKGYRENPWARGCWCEEVA